MICGGFERVNEGQAQVASAASPSVSQTNCETNGLPLGYLRSEDNNFRQIVGIWA